MPRTKIAAVLTALAVALGGAIITVAGAAPAAALTCTRSWTGMVSNNWDNKDNWSPNNSAPTSEDVACIAGGTVSLDSGNNHLIGSIILGGEGNPTLKVSETNNVTLMIVDQLYVEAGATLQVGGPDTQGTSIGPSLGNTTATFVNNGTITFTRPLTNGDPWQTPADSLSLNGVNNGTMTLVSGWLNLPARFTNHGTYTSGANTGTWPNGGSGAIFDNAGTVINGGIFHVANSTWRQRGTTTGNPIVLRNQTLFDDISGAGAFTLWTVHLQGTISADQAVSLGSGDGGAQITVDAPSTIASGATVTSQLDGNGYSLKGESITNHGTLEINAQPNSNGFRFEAPFVNAADGTVSLRTGRADTFEYGLTNHGLITVDPGARIGIQWEAGKLTNAADGTLRFGIAAADSYGAILGWGSGHVVPGGTIAGELVGSYDPAAGTEFPVVQALPDAGRFASVAGGFTAVYADDHIALRRGGAAHRTTLAIRAPGKVAKGSRAAIATTLTDTTTDRGAGGKKVVLWKATGPTWAKVATRSTDATGRASVEVKVRTATRFRWTFAGNRTLAAATSATATVRLHG